MNPLLKLFKNIAPVLIQKALTKDNAKSGSSIASYVGGVATVATYATTGDAVNALLMAVISVILFFVQGWVSTHMPEPVIEHGQDK